MQPSSIIQKIHKMNAKSDDEDDDTEAQTRANTRANAGIDELEMEEGESDVSSTTAGSDTDDTESVSTGMNDDDDDDDDVEVDIDELMNAEGADIETPAMLAKKTATAASTIANSDAKKKATIANKRAIASSKPPRGKATLQDITTLQNSYDDLAHDEDEVDSDEVSDDEEGSENYLRKFESEMHQSYIESCHQEMMHLNNAEVSALARVVRNADGVIVDAMHKTMPFLTKYEKTRVLGQRAKQLNQGAQPMIPFDKKIIDGYLIAQLELQQKALPFIIRRPMPGGKSEYWRLADLEII
jgi:DNA-directed RNA polymerase I, II, and III subunit RPABC2